MLEKKMNKYERAIAHIEIAKHVKRAVRMYRKNKGAKGYESQTIIGTQANFAYEYLNAGWNVQLDLDRDWKNQIECWSKIISDFKFAAQVEETGKLNSQYYAALDNYEAGVFHNDPEYSFEVMAQALKDLVLFTDK